MFAFKDKLILLFTFNPTLAHTDCNMDFDRHTVLPIHSYYHRSNLGLQQ